MASNARRRSSRDDSNPFWMAVQSCFSLARSPSGMEDVEPDELGDADSGPSAEVTDTMGGGEGDPD